MGQENSSIPSAFASSVEQTELERISGFQLSSVLPDSPGMIAGLIPYFDIITAIDGVDIATCTTEDQRLNFFKSCISSHINIPVLFEVYNLKTRKKRVVSCIPSREWGGSSILGCSILWTRAMDAVVKCIHVVGVSEGSAAAACGMLHAESDYIVGYRLAGQSTTSMMEAGETFLHSVLVDVVQKKAKEDPYIEFFLLVYNNDTNIIQEVPLEISSERIGIAIASGILHIIPPPSTTTHGQGASVESETNDQMRTPLPRFIPPSRSSVQSPLPCSHLLILQETPPNNLESLLPAFPAAPPPPTIPAPPPPDQSSFAPAACAMPVGTENLAEPALAMSLPPAPPLLLPDPLPVFPLPPPQSIFAPPPISAPLPVSPETLVPSPPNSKTQEMFRFDPDQPLNSLDPHPHIIPSFPPGIIPTFPDAVTPQTIDSFKGSLEPHASDPTEKNAAEALNLVPPSPPLPSQDLVGDCSSTEQIDSLHVVTSVKRTMDHLKDLPEPTSTLETESSHQAIASQYLAGPPETLVKITLGDVGGISPCVPNSKECVEVKAPDADVSGSRISPRGGTNVDLNSTRQGGDPICMVPSPLSQTQVNHDMVQDLEYQSLSKGKDDIPPPPPPLRFPLFSEIMLAKEWE